MQNVLEELLALRIPAEYEAASVLQREVLNEIFSRLDFMTLIPRTVLDAGCATGNAAIMLKQKYPAAKIIAVDPSSAMLEYARQRDKQIDWLQASLTMLPFENHSIDLIMANLNLPWCDGLQALLAEWRRVLRGDGLLIVTSLGPDTLRELHDLPLAFPHFMDMHTVGDLLTQAGFSSPVLDVDYFTLTYQDPKKLWHELQVTGMITGNTGSIQLKKIEDRYPLTYEIIFAHAWGSVVQPAGEVRIPVSHILRRG
ncbi:MAG TPA: methyltransferase domain-containing protein [Gammaproteobacteria bacterium]|nr:methyltransferase domain-containing protein [Gammaproteobacteria bacterium]